MMLGARTSAWAGKALPYDAEVEYLEASGTQFIDTLYHCSNRSVFECDFMFLRSSGSSTIFGSRVRFNGQVDGPACPAFWINSSGNLAVNYGYESWYDSQWRTKEINDVMFHKLKLSENKYSYVDGIEFVNAYSSEVFVSPVSTGIFRQKFIDGFDIGENRPLSGRLKSFRVSEDDVAILDLVSVRFTNSLGVSEGAMYDRVSGQLFRNAGTGAFIIGSDKVSAEGGGTKCLTARRSYRRSLRPSARFRAHSQRWEVAA